MKGYHNCLPSNWPGFESRRMQTILHSLYRKIFFLCMCGIHPEVVILPPHPQVSYFVAPKLILSQTFERLSVEHQSSTFTIFLLRYYSGPGVLGSGLRFRLARARVRNIRVELLLMYRFEVGQHQLRGGRAECNTLQRSTGHRALCKTQESFKDYWRVLVKKKE